VIKDWDSRWFAKDNAFGDILVEDYQLRKFLKKRLFDAGIPKIEIERDAAKVRIHIHCSRPGVVIAAAAVNREDSPRVRKNDQKGKTKVMSMSMSLRLSLPKIAQLVAENIDRQLVGRVSSRALKQAIGRRNEARCQGHQG
jgi:small subunit ribosomal protein S3